MFAKVYNFKFPGLSEAKVAATFCSEKLGKKIVPFNIRSLNISIGNAEVFLLILSSSLVKI